MAVVGFGKQPGAAQIHACGPVEMRNRILDGIAALRATGRLLGGVGIHRVGRAARSCACRRSPPTTSAAPAEIELTDYSRTLVPALPFPQIDVLIIDKGGKDISGTTMDPNVTGRFWVHGLADLAEPDVSTIVLLDITAVSGGNVLGIGFADFIPSAARAADRLAEDVRQLLHRRHRRRAPQPDADGAAHRGRLHQGRAQHVRPCVRPAQASGAHREHAAHDALLGQRRAAAASCRPAPRSWRDAR